MCLPIYIYLYLTFFFCPCLAHDRDMCTDKLSIGSSSLGGDGGSGQSYFFLYSFPCGEEFTYVPTANVLRVLH